MTATLYSQEGGKIFVSQANQLLILKKHIWSRSNHLTKSSSHLLTRECKPLSKSDSKRNNECSESDGSHKVHNYWNYFDFLQSEFLSSLSSAFTSSLCLYINTWFAYLLCFYVCISGQWVAVTELLSEKHVKIERARGKGTQTDISLEQGSVYQKLGKKTSAVLFVFHGTVLCIWRWHPHRQHWCHPWTPPESSNRECMHLTESAEASSLILFGIFC